MQFMYLGALLVSLGGLTVLDWRFKLAFWSNARTTTMVLACTLMVFVFWDIMGIVLGIFKQGSSQYALNLSVVPEFPIEELFFLSLLVYVTLLLWRGSERRWPRT